ncbi:PucR family transcriptional regulator [Streptomyces sulphureus]|uniref:PucR family transcriptional regulator n=1 Tax=Streptomyces sulphureus TaxID=47758 RepID=UPI0003AA6F0D|nr:PucR family transcriptional regulator [Streptomyces sulphureus]
MIPSVREVLGLPVVAAGAPRVVSGSTHLDRRVRWVHISESADLTDLLEGGELVLTTGLPLAGGPQEAARYLRMLAEQQVAGLVVELGTRLQELPGQLGPLADSLELPVVVLADEIRFVEVTQQVHRLIVADRYEELEFARTAHEVFTSLNIARASTADIVARASQILGAPLVLEDLNHRVLASCSAGHSTACLLDQWPERSRLDQGRTSEERWTTVPVGFGDERWGRLVLPEPGTASARGAARARMVLERAAQSLQLHRMLQREQDALVLQALGGLLDDLVGGRVTDGSEALARAGALGLAPGARYVPLVARMPERTDTDALGQGEADRRLLTSVRQAVAGGEHTALVSLRRAGTVALVLSCPAADAVEAALEGVCTGVEEQLAGRAYGRTRWVAGTAAASADLVAAARGLREAEHVAEVALSLPGSGKRLHRSTDVRLRGLMALLRGDHRVQAFAEAEIGTLLDHDARTGHRTLELLRTYLECSGSKTLTAQRTGLSRPTLYSRLRTVERILGVSLESAESRASLHAALMVVDAAAD